MRASTVLFHLALAGALLAGVARAQSDKISATINFSIQGTSWQCCTAIVGESDSGVLNIVAGGQQVGLGFQHLHVAGGSYSDGGGNGNWTFTFTLSNGDILVFDDRSSTLEGASGSGTAPLSFGSGIFDVATGQVFYTLACTAQCDTKDDMLVAPSSSFSLSGHGSLLLPAEISNYQAASVVVNPPPNATENYDTSGQFNLHYGPGGQGGHKRSAQDSGGGSIEITPELLPMPVSYTVTASCSNLPANNCWVTAPATASGTIPAFSSTKITAGLNTPSLPSGTYPAQVTVTIAPQSSGGSQVPPPPAPSTINVNLSLIVTAPEPQLTLSTTGVQLQTVSGGSMAPLTQAVMVSNSGTGALAFQAAASTLSGGNWLSVSGTAGSAPATVTISANPAGLSPGTYFGRVDFSSAGAFASPQSVEVALTVSPSSKTTPAAISPAGLVFVAAAGTNPPPQTVEISSPGGQTFSFNSQPQYHQGDGWLAINGPSLVTAAHPTSQSVSVNTAGLAPGVYTATLSEQFTQPTMALPVAVVLVVTRSLTAGAIHSHASTACTPTQLLPVFTSMGDGFQARAGLPVTLQAMVIDDCGSPLNAGSVVASFGPSDTPALLTSVGNGQWSGTWLPHNTTGGAASITINADSFVPALHSTATISGKLAAGLPIPLIGAGGIVNAASLANSSLAPGTYISIFGSNLASGTASAPIPYPATLSGTEVFLGGERLPLVYGSGGQINAVIPYDVPLNTELQLFAQNGNVASMPQTVAIAATQPAVFSQNGSGTGAGVIVVAKSDGTQFVATPAKPASRGDAVVIYCTGLGAIDATLAPGAAAPLSPVAQTLTPATATIGGLPAQVFFSGLTPGFFGLYQVNAYVPTGVTPGTDVPVVITIDGASSPPVTLAIR